MIIEVPYYLRFTDGESSHTDNLASSTWTLSYPTHHLLHSDSGCIGSTTNNKVEYDDVIGLLTDAINLRIHRLHVHLDS